MKETVKTYRIGKAREFHARSRLLARGTTRTGTLTSATKRLCGLFLRAFIILTMAASILHVVKEIQRLCKAHKKSFLTTSTCTILPAKPGIKSEGVGSEANAVNNISGKS